MLLIGVGKQEFPHYVSLPIYYKIFKQEEFVVVSPTNEKIQSKKLFRSTKRIMRTLRVGFIIINTIHHPLSY